jgi:hypothetical protein
MTDPKPYIIANWIADDLRSVDYFSFRDQIQETLKNHMSSWSEEKIAETAEKLESAIFFELGQIADQLLQDGIEPSFQIDGEPGTAYIKSINLEATSELIRLRKKTPEEFELFCSNVLSSLGAVSRNVGGTGDGGIDFISTDLPVSNCKFTALRGCNPVVIGQAKRYKDGNLVNVNEVREFLGGALLKQDEIKREKESLGLFTPVIFAFWTTSNFTSPARKFLRDAGIWYLSGFSLAQLSLYLGVEK